MAKYTVTGALVQVRGNTADGSSALIYVYRGGIVDLDDAQAEHLTSVNLVTKVEDVTDDPIVAAGPAQSVMPEVSVRPDEDADQSVWVAYAVHNGLSREDAEKASQEDLIAIFGDQSEPKRSARRAKAAPATPAAPAPAAPAAEAPAAPAAPASGS